MNTRRNTSRSVEKAVAGGDQASPQAPTAGVEVPLNPAALADGVIRETLVQMDKASHYSSTGYHIPGH